MNHAATGSVPIQSYCWDQDEHVVRVHLKPAACPEDVSVEFRRFGFDVSIAHEGLRYSMSVDSLCGPIDPERCSVRTRSGGSYAVLRLAKERGRESEWPALLGANGGVSACDQAARQAVRDLGLNT